MSNVAYADFGADRQPTVQRVADLDDGYARIANEILEQLARAELTSRHFRLMNAILRKTYGFGKKVDRIADTQLVELTGLPRQKVNKAKNELLDMRVLVMEGRAIGPNKNLHEWDIPEKNHSGVIVTKTVTKNVTKTVTQVSPSWSHTKETITKEKKETKSVTEVTDMSPPTEAKDKPEKSRLSCDEVWQALRECVPDARGWKAITPKRRARIQKFWREVKPIAKQFGDAEPFNLDSFRQYLNYLHSSCRWMFEDRHDNSTGKTWQKRDYEYILSAEVYAQVREGEKDDR